jgi:hypothetical protein
MTGSQMPYAPGVNSDKSTYCAFWTAAPTASMDLFAIESGAAKTMRIRLIVITNIGMQTTAGVRALQLIRTTTAGTGSAVVPQAVDSGDAAYSGIVRSGNTGGNLGTAAATALHTYPIFAPGAVAAYNGPYVIYPGALSGLMKDPTGIPGITNGISLRDPGASGGASMSGYVIFTEE